MKTFSDIIARLNITDRKPTIGQVRTTVTSWGKRNQTSRQMVKISLWLDSEDKNDRVVICGEVILNLKKTAPEKCVDLSLEIHRYSGYDPVRRRLTISHPEQYFRIDGQSNPENVKSMFASLSEQIGTLVLDDRYPIPGIKDYVAA